MISNIITLNQKEPAVMASPLRSVEIRLTADGTDKQILALLIIKYQAISKTLSTVARRAMSYGFICACTSIKQINTPELLKPGSGLFKSNALERVLTAFSPRDALLMGYRITRNIMYGIGIGVHCTTWMIRRGRHFWSGVNQTFLGKADWQVRRIRVITGLGERRITTK